MLQYSNDISKVTIFFTNKVVKANKLCIKSVHFIKQRRNHAYLNIGTYNIRLYILLDLYNCINTCFFNFWTGHWLVASCLHWKHGQSKVPHVMKPCNRNNLPVGGVILLSLLSSVIGWKKCDVGSYATLTSNWEIKTTLIIMYI